MGSYTELTIDDYPVYSSKSYVSSDIGYIFCESDKKIFNRKINERNRIDLLGSFMILVVM